MYTTDKFEKLIDIDEYLQRYVNVEEFEECCKACPNYGGLWSCPPYNFRAEDYWKDFSKLLVVGRKITFCGELSQEEAMEIMLKVKGEMAEELYARETSEAGAVSLSAGSCDLCSSVGCTRKEGNPCRYPGKMRYSIESLGGNVGLTVSRLLGIELEWIEEGKVPSYFVLVGGLLIK